MLQLHCWAIFSFNDCAVFNTFLYPTLCWECGNVFFNLEDLFQVSRYSECLKPHYTIHVLIPLLSKSSNFGFFPRLGSPFSSHCSLHFQKNLWSIFNLQEEKASSISAFILHYIAQISRACFSLISDPKQNIVEIEPCKVGRKIFLFHCSCHTAFSKPPIEMLIDNKLCVL